MSTIKDKLVNQNVTEISDKDGELNEKVLKFIKRFLFNLLIFNVLLFYILSFLSVSG